MKRPACFPVSASKFPVPRLIGGTRTEVSDAQGRYRFVAIPPGDYNVKFELPGFSTVVHEAIRVALGFTANVNAEMRVASQQETITVRGDSPVVDTQSTRVTNTYEAEQMAHLPSARDFAALMASTPSVQASRVDVGGSAALSENSYRTYGILGTQDRPLVEGMLGSENTSLLFYTDYGSFEEVSINTAGNNAEMPGNGVYSSFIAKSGGNRYRGNVYLDYYNKSFSSVNIDDDLKRRGVTGSSTLRAEDTNRTDMYRDFNGDLGGYIAQGQGVVVSVVPAFGEQGRAAELSRASAAYAGRQPHRQADLQPEPEQQADRLHQPQQQEPA